jgi:3-deoxy-7-phosphoheptulonate synthase
VGVKLGPSATVAQVEGLWETLNPGNERGRLVFITRMGASRASALLPPLVDALAKRRAAALWICDPMHGNGTVLSDGLKTRSFDAILEELEATCEVFERAGVPLGGVHFELTGEDVAECLGGAAGVREEDLRRHYASPCDPRLNYRQSLEMAFLMARRLAPRR